LSVEVDGIVAQHFRKEIHVAFPSPPANENREGGF